MLLSRIFVAAPLAILLAGQAEAAATITNHYTVTLDTGLRDFIANFPGQTIAGDGSVTGSTVSDVSNRNTVPAFNPNYGVLQNIVSVVSFLGYPFEATYQVEGATNAIGDQVIAHEVVSGTIEMDINGSEAASTPFSVTLNPNCTAANNGFTVVLCSDQQKQTYFTSSTPVVVQAGETINFKYTLSETDVSCEVLPVGNGTPEVCIEGDTGITDLNNINDPQWDGSLAVTYDYVPEPASLTLLGIGLAALPLARRRRIRGR